MPDPPVGLVNPIRYAACAYSLISPGTPGRGALHDFYLDDKHQRDVPTRANYDRDALLDPRGRTRRYAAASG